MFKFDRLFLTMEKKAFPHTGLGKNAVLTAKRFAD